MLEQSSPLAPYFHETVSALGMGLRPEQALVSRPYEPVL
jgi:hypothetical protein